MRQHYSTDLTDNQWERIKPLIEEKTHGKGRPSTHDKRDIVDGVFYILQTGCAWRLLPHDFPNWHTVYNHFREWQNLGTWEKINGELVREYRKKHGKTEEASAAIIDSQTVRTTEKGAVAEDMMEQKKSKEEKDISSSTRKGFCSRQKLRVLISAIKKAL